MTLRGSIPLPVRGRTTRGDAVPVEGRPTEPYLFGRALVLVLLAGALDLFNYLDRGGWPRYVLLLVPLGVVALIRLRMPSGLIRRPSVPDRFLVALLLFGLIGTLYGIFVRHTSATSLPIFSSMTLAFLYLPIHGRLTEGDAARLLRAIERVALLYMVLNAVVSAGAIPGLYEFRQFRNASLIFVGLGLAATIVFRHWGRLLLLLAMWALSFSIYPSGTSVLIALTIAVSLLITDRGNRRVRAYLLVLGTVAAAVLVALNFNTAVDLANDYFSLVGKSNNNDIRLAVWTSGMERFEESPAFGDAFSGPTVITTENEWGKEFELPYHNAYVQFLAGGGILGVALLAGWILSTEVMALRNHSWLVASQAVFRAGLLRTLLVGFNVFFVSAAFNGTIMGLSRAAAIFLLYGMMMLLGPPGRPEQPA
jgi:O-antigen ligase